MRSRLRIRTERYRIIIKLFVLLAGCSAPVNSQLVVFQPDIESVISEVSREIPESCPWTMVFERKQDTVFDEAIAAELNRRGTGLIPATCSFYRQACDFAETLSDHSVPEVVTRWKDWCPLANQCDKYAEKIRDAQQMIDRWQPPNLYATRDAKSAVLTQYAQHLDSHEPDLAAAIGMRLGARIELQRMGCDAVVSYLQLTLQTGQAMLGRNSGTHSYLRSLLPRLSLTPKQLLSLLTPDTAAYRHLVLHHIHYQELVTNGGFGQSEEGLGPLSPGRRKSAKAGRLAARLAREGLHPLPAEGPTTQRLALRGKLLEAVKKFQQMHLLEASGQVGPETLGALRMSADTKLKAIGHALKKYRQAVPPWEPHFLVVQVPQAFVEYYADSVFVHRYRAVVGNDIKVAGEGNDDAVRPFMTRPLNATLTAITFNPQWNVPDRIGRDEIAKREERDEGYLARYGFRRISAGDRQVRYVQAPGPRNALGKVKFRLPHTDSIYLHDTPDKSLFKHPRRLYSHGCVRVQHAVKLAAQILSRDHGLTWDGLRRLLKSGENVERKLKIPLPVHVIYSTAAADSDGNLYFMPDVYQLEK